ncbi:uncharacterized protein [Chironomus tepperi]|uniref:uncharacterized protein n=1 Tax=Chironomus tepperi TaxID=113505 RepID=UPI00391FC3AA
MNKIILTAFCFVLTLSIATSININCSYQNRGFYAISSALSCSIKSVTSEDNPNVFITGTHTYHTNNDVLGLSGSLGNIQVFPKGLKSIFKNLKAFYVSGKIKEIHQDDLSPYPDLVVLILDHNLIEVVEKGLFDHNPNLEAISFWQNPIKHINVNAFDNLPKLRYYWMSGCANVYKENNRPMVLTEITRAKSQCQAYVETTSTTSTTSTTTTTPAPVIVTQNCPEAPPSKDFFTIHEKLDYLTNKILELDGKLDNITEVIEKIKAH